MFRREKKLIFNVIKVNDSEIERLVSYEVLKTLIKYLILGEDKRFYQHHGFDLIAIFRAFYKNIFKGCNEGASTINQQLVRTITGDYRICFTRKIKEIMLAIWIDKKFTKNQIATCYLRIAYYGTRYPNLETYLYSNNLKKCQEIDDLTAANIIARLKYPEPKQLNIIKLKKIDRRVSYLLKLNGTNTI